MAKYLKPQTPLQHQNGDYIYPLTTVDQVIIDKDNRLNSLFKKTIKEIATLQVAGWSDTKPYAQTITLNHSVDDYDVDANVAYGDEDNAALHVAAGCLSYIKKNNNTITFYCLKKKPDIDLPVEISGTCRNTIADITIEEGIDTSDATATTNDILIGKTAYVNGELITGSYEGVGLNFKVVGGTTQPSNPTENMIWINTDTEITGYYFSSTQPENMIDGEVWIPTGSPSTIKVNVLKENGVIVCPLSTHQMISGELKEVPAKCYQNGEWNELWNGYLFNNGNIPGIVTGWKNNAGGSYLTFTVGNIITATAENYGVVYFYPTPAIDLTPYSKFVVDMVVDRYESGYDNYICISKQGTDTTEARKLTSGTNRQTLELDISAFEGDYYCGAYIKSWRGAKTTAKIYSMKLVK